MSIFENKRAVLVTGHCDSYFPGTDKISIAKINAPQESFFGHMKDEIKGALPKCQSLTELKMVIKYYMDYYNTERYQWDMCKLAPAEYYEYCISGELPGMDLYEAAMA